MFLYHILIDRFAGWTDDDAGRVAAFRGGNIRGIFSQLHHIRSLGANGILLSPFYKGRSYHGYHITDYEDIDERFGTWSDLRLLVDEVHRRGMVIVADFVANHCHRDNPLVRLHPDWFKRDRRGRTRGYEGIGFLPEFDLTQPEAAEYMTERGLDLCRLGFDGIRLDYAKGPSLRFWEHFRKTIKAAFPHVFLLGEVWGKPHAKRLPTRLLKAVRRNEMSVQEAWQMRYAGILDAVFDFEYQFLINEAARSGRIKGNAELQAAVERHFARFADCPELSLVLFLDNHDTNRFLFNCGNKKQLLQEAIDFTRSLNRPFSMYYGTEIGMTNKRDIFDGTPYADERVRECFPPGRER